jgi:hypothetical protein
MAETVRHEGAIAPGTCGWIVRFLCEASLAPEWPSAQLERLRVIAAGEISTISGRHRANGRRMS